MWKWCVFCIPYSIVKATSSIDGIFTQKNGGSMKNLSRILLITLFLFGITTNAFATAPLPPVPEPATAMLFGLGVLAIAGISRRKK